MSHTVFCPYCNNQTDLVTSQQFYGVDYGTHLYVCTPCDARVGAHKHTLEPLGTMADSLLRKTRMDTHKVVDPIWRNPFSVHNRSAVYKAISKLMNIPIEETHIGMFDYGKCHAVMFLARTGEIERYLHDQAKMRVLKRKERKKREKENFMRQNPGKLPNGTTDTPIPKGETLYGIYSTVSKKFVFGIQEPSKTKANKKLFKRIGKDAYKYRFEVRKLKHYIITPETKEENHEAV